MSLAIGSPTKQWDSVACSGAQSYDASNEYSASYKGQGKGGAKVWSNGSTPRLEGYLNWQSLKTTALNEFIPGRHKQIEFVAKYKPKAVTLTMGGNDVDFGGKIKACIDPFSTCPVATAQGRIDLAKEIRAQFKDSLVPFYQELKRASPSTKFYILGYVQALNPDENPSCRGNEAHGINDEERRAIYEGYAYMNQVLEAATARVGFKFIDVEDALDSRRLCDQGEGDRFVTGITSGWGNGGSNERQESFHPNAKGHQAIFNKIQQELKVSQTQYDLLTYPYSQEENTSITAPDPDPGSYLEIPIGQEDGAVQSTNITDSTSIKKNILTDLRLNPYSGRPGTSMQATLHSDPLDLGSLSVNEDGSLSSQITIPASIPSGYHTLVLEGQSYSGEPVKYEQVVFVYGDENDLDEDGILDSSDPCLFVTPLNQDVDLDGIDDGCDGEVRGPRLVYRLRGGDLLRTYQGSPEDVNKLYLERNIYAGAITGVFGDYDPDGDDYVVIAATQGSVPLGRYANLQIVSAQQPNQIYASFRTPENGCVKYRPTDVSQVTSSSGYRTFAQETTDTNTCRSQSSSDDLDEDGQPDNTQTLYVARNGDPSKGEVATKLYLFRSTRAAEAQLGISDYAPSKPNAPSTIPAEDNTDYRTDNSLLASTQSNPLLPVTYKKIHMVGNTPYVLATVNTLGLCQAYKPASTATIQKSTQTTINLTLDVQQTLNAVVGGWCG